MDYDKKIASLTSESLAVQSVLINVLRQLVLHNPNLLAPIERGFDIAASETENQIFRFAKDDDPRKDQPNSTGDRRAAGLVPWKERKV
jgi:hypothetical protein